MMPKIGIIIPIIYYIVLPLVITALFLRKSEKKSYLAGVGILAVTTISLIIFVFITMYFSRFVPSSLEKIGDFVIGSLIGMYGIILIYGIPIASVINLILLVPIVKILRKDNR
ncbi:hypothetical protein GOV06_02980 [Candidatus Woesearchaeota archaeon]|nr:hypothetical protein [Candidatus Woesearchaeota archaeon]